MHNEFPATGVTLLCRMEGQNAYPYLLFVILPSVQKARDTKGGKITIDL
jgi:hypothetical protein